MEPRTLLLQGVLKYPVTILLLLLITLQTFSKWCLIAEFRVNRDFISKTLCVNRDNALSCCKGTCYLNKKVAEDESQQQTPGKSAQREETVLQVNQHGLALPAPSSVIVLIRHSTRHLAGISQRYALSFYPPPRQLSLA